jgi:tetratricopeptide (TPR) repeat protein
MEMSIVKTLLALPVMLVVFALGLPCLAQDSSTIEVTTKDGRSLNVQVLGIKDNLAELKVFGFGGEATIKRDINDFRPESAFAIERRALDPKTFEQHFALAKQAALLDLLPQAGLQARSAVKAAGTGPDAEAKKKEVRAWAADALEKMIGTAVGAGDLDRATDCLEILTTKLADERTDDQLAKITESVEGLRDQVEGKKADAAAAKLDAKRKADLEKSLQPIRALAAKGDKTLSDAIAKAKSTSTSARLCESAVESYKSAWKQAQELAQKNPEDAALQQQLAPLFDRLVDQALRAALHAANVLTLQGDYRGATDWVNRILAFDPDNKEAKEMQKTIILASAASSDRDDYRFGWGRRR